MDIHTLHKQGHSIRSIADITGHSRNTIRKALRQKAQMPFAAPKRASKLDSFKGYVEQRYNECALSAIRLLQEIRPMGYTGSIITLRRFVQSLKPAKRAAQRATVRFETPPGQQAQADWAYCGRFRDSTGCLVPIYAFVMVLSFSRMLYVEFTSSMKIESLIQCHLNAFAFFGGWTQSLLYDNMKQVKLDRNTWNPLFIDFANHYGITVKTHQIRRPRTKGKVERMVHYLKNNFLNGRVFIDLSDMNIQARHWMDHEANVRLHATTGQRPVDLFANESLTALSVAPAYRISQKFSRKVDSEGFVRCRHARYSVPPEHVGKTVIVELDDQKIIVRSDDLIIAEHRATRRPGATVVDKQHVAQMWKISLERPSAPAPHWDVTFNPLVAAVPLSVYEEAAR
jgi:transposase